MSEVLVKGQEIKESELKLEVSKELNDFINFAQAHFIKSITLAAEKEGVKLEVAILIKPTQMP